MKNPHEFLICKLRGLSQICSALHGLKDATLSKASLEALSKTLAEAASTIQTLTELNDQPSKIKWEDSTISPASQNKVNPLSLH